MGPRDTALDFVRRFAGGDVDGLAGLLAEELHLSGPYLEVTSRADYLEALRHDPPEPCEVRVLDVSEDGEGITVRCEYLKADGPLEVEQWFGFEGGKIRRTRLAFEVAS